MKLLFKQRFFSWFDSYDIYDESGNTMFVVKGELAWGHLLRIYDAGGNEVKLSDFVGKPIVLNFWATWCGYCVMEMPDFNDAYKAYPDVQFLMVNATHSSWTETVATAKAYVEKEGYDFDVFYDTAGEAQAVFALNSYPQTFFFNEKGELVAHRPGAMNYSMLVSYIEAIIK